ncbi:hypothetical protein EDE11_104109 [Methylomonas methanica]|uniref:Uncharacterized protein n=1 Tax=Methylomonas methanica TaxID=421 RepID=A0ABY2CQE6_METMH|nr:hypothetical protein EDE11_104109 [Methylomonas methanica]
MSQSNRYSVLRIEICFVPFALQIECCDFLILFSLPELSD